MTKINDLLQSINIFHNEAMHALVKAAAPETWSMPDDPEEDEAELPDDPSTGKYNKMVDLARKVRSPDLSSEILLVAELYKKALELNAGYSSVNAGVNNLINDLLAENDDEDDPEVEMVEDVLNDVVKDLRARAGGPAGLAKEDPPAVKMQLRELKNAFNRKAIEEETEPGAPDMMGGGGGLSEEDREGLTEQTGEGDLTQYDEKAKSTFDLSGGVGLEARQQGAGSGVSFTRRKAPKDWIVSYRNERERYQDLLSKESNKLVSNKIKRLVDVLSQLETNTASEMALSEALMETRAPADIDQFGNRVPSKKKTEFGAPDPVKEAELAKIREENANLKKERTALKVSIKNTELQKTQNAFEAELAKTKDPKERFLLEQEIALRKLQQSSDVNIGPEAEARRRLIRAISKRKVETLDNRELWEINMPSKETLMKLIEAIQIAAQKKISREEYNKNEAKKIQQHFAPGEEGKRKRGKPVNFEGKVIALRQSLATQKSELKKKLLKRLSKQDELSIFRSIHDQIAAAITAGNNAAIEAAKKELKKAMGDWSENEPATQAFMENSKKFYAFLESCFTLVKSKVLENEVVDAMVPAIDAISDQGNQLVMEFNNTEGFLPIVKKTAEIIADLELATGKVTKKANDMTTSKSNTRKKILAELEKNLTKKADDQNNLAGPEQNMDDLCHKVFLDVLRDIEINGFDE